MSDTDPILLDDDDATVRRKIMATLDEEGRAKMANNLDNPRYLAAARAAAARPRAETAPHRSLIPTEIHRVFEDLRQRDPESRERAAAVWSDPTAVSELARALAKEKAHLLARAAESEASDAESAKAATKPRMLWGVMSAAVLVIALAGLMFVVFGRSKGEPTSTDAKASPASSAEPAASADSAAMGSNANARASAEATTDPSAPALVVAPSTSAASAAPTAARASAVAAKTAPRPSSAAPSVQTSRPAASVSAPAPSSTAGFYVIKKE